MAGARRGPVYLLEIANGASCIANAMVMIIIPWLVLEQTGSAAAAGVVVAGASLPGVVIAPVAGWLVDRFGRRRVSIVSDALSAVSVAAFPLVAMTRDLTLGWLIVLAVLGAAFDPAGATSRRAMLPDVAEASSFPLDRLNGIHEGVFGVGWTVGPAVGALLIAELGAEEAFWVPFALFLVAILATVLLHIGDAGQQARRESAVELAAWRGFWEGIRILWRDRVLRVMTVAVTIMTAFYLPTESVILPTYFTDLAEPTHLGLVLSVLSAGTIAGAFGYGWLAARATRYQLAKVVLVGTVVAIVPLALLLPLPIMLVAAFALGLAWGPFNPLMNTLVQRRVAPDYQGRVYGVQLSLLYAAPPVAFLLTGLAVESAGVRPAYLGLALLMCVTAIGVLLVPSLRDIDD